MRRTAWTTGPSSDSCWKDSQWEQPPLAALGSNPLGWLMHRNVPSLVEQITFVHGPRDLFRQYASIADERARDLGLRLRISTDFEKLVAINTQHRDSWSNLIPIFNPAYSHLNAGNAFLIEGIDEQGDTVATSAGRLYDFGERSLAGELHSLRVFYAEPAPFVARGESVELAAPAAEHICGRTMFSGSVWVHPHYRRHGLTRTIPRLTRSYALTVWNPPVFWMIIEPEVDEVGVTRAYGSWDFEGTLEFRVPTWRGDMKVLLYTMGQTTLIRDIMSSVYGRNLASVRRRDHE
jgi:hypothetical protein